MVSSISGLLQLLEESLTLAILFRVVRLFRGELATAQLCVRGVVLILSRFACL